MLLESFSVVITTPCCQRCLIFLFIVDVRAETALNRFTRYTAALLKHKDPPVELANQHNEQDPLDNSGTRVETSPKLYALWMTLVAVKVQIYVYVTHTSNINTNKTTFYYPNPWIQTWERWKMYIQCLLTFLDFDYQVAQYVITLS